MNAEERKRIRIWIEEEFEFLKAEDRDEALVDYDHPHLVAEAVIDRLIDKYEAELPNKYDELRKIIDDWWMRTASLEQIRAYSAYCRELAKIPLGTNQSAAV